GRRGNEPKTGYNERERPAGRSRPSAIAKFCENVYNKSRYPTQKGGRPMAQATNTAQRRCAGGITYTLTRRQVRNINLRVRADGSVAASAAPRVPAGAVDAFVASHAGWVAAAQARAAARQAAEDAAPLPDPAVAKARITALCETFFPLFAALCPGGRMPR